MAQLWHIRVPKELFKLKNGAVLVAVFTTILSYKSKKGVAFPSLNRLAKDLKCGTWKISKSIDTLHKLKILNKGYDQSLTTYWEKNISKDFINIEAGFIKHICKLPDFCWAHLGTYIYLKYCEEEGTSPTIKEITSYCCVSTQNTSEYLTYLIKNKFIERQKSKTHNQYSLLEIPYPKILATDETVPKIIVEAISAETNSNAIINFLSNQLKNFAKNVEIDTFDDDENVKIKLNVSVNFKAGDLKHIQSLQQKDKKLARKVHEKK